MPSPRIVVPVAGALTAGITIVAVLLFQLPSPASLIPQNIQSALPKLAPLQQGMPSITPTIEGRDEALLHLRRGDLLAVQGQWSMAAEEYQAAVNADGGLPALRKLAQAQLQKRDVRSARDTAQQMRREGAKDEDLLLLESIILLRTGELQQAQTLLEGAPDSPQKSYGLALLAIIRNDHQTAQAQLANVVAGWEPVLRSYARILQSAYEEYALFPESPALHLTALLSRSLAQVQECELALPMLHTVTQAQNDYRDAWIVQGYCELTGERYQEALASLERSYQIDPEKPEIQYFLARAYAGLNDHQNAITFLQYALQNGFEPQSEVRRFLVTQAIETSNTPLAIEQLDAMTQASDATIETYAQFVTVSLAANQQEAAYLKALEATQKWPDDADAFVLLGKAAAQTDREDEARTAYERALQINPSMVEAREGLENL